MLHSIAYSIESRNQVLRPWGDQLGGSQEIVAAFGVQSVRT